MGFLDNLLKKETRKFIGNAVEGVMDSIINTSGNAIRSAMQTTGDDEASCNRSVSTVRGRIEKILAEDHPGYSFKKDIPFSRYNIKPSGRCTKHEIDYIIADSTGRETAAVLLLSPGMDRTLWLENLYSALNQKGIKHVHFLMHLPNRGSYIREKLEEILK